MDQTTPVAEALLRANEMRNGEGWQMRLYRFTINVKCRTRAGTVRDSFEHLSMPRSRKVTQAQYETLAAFRFALRQFFRFSEQAAQEAGVTPQQHQALLAIKGFPGGHGRVSVGELAERLQIAHHSAVGLIDRLTVEKLVKREHSKEDRRRVDVFLTKRGEALLETLSATHHEELRRIGPGIRELLEKISDVP